MPDPVSTTASAVSILDRVAAALRWILGRRGDKRPRIPGRPTHTAFEVRPVVFHLDLTQSQPRAELGFHAINYLRRDLVLTELKVTRFDVSGGPMIEHVQLVQEFTIPARSSFPVFCGRNLMDSEIRVLLAERRRDWWSGSVALVARAKAGRKEYTYGPVAAQVIEGWLQRPGT